MTLVLERVKQIILGIICRTDTLDHIKLNCMTVEITVMVFNSVQFYFLSPHASLLFIDKVSQIYCVYFLCTHYTSFGS